MANSWFRLYAEFANDAKVQMLSETDQRRLVMLFCLRCNGDETLQDEQVAFQLRISNEEWAKSKVTFISKSFINSDNEVLNWDKRQYISDSSTGRVAKYREKMKQEGNVSVTPPDTDTDTEHKKQCRANATALLQFLNSKTNRDYRPVDSNLRMIMARLDEYSLEDLKAMTAKKCREWAKDEKMKDYLRPATLYNAIKCAQYIGELVKVETHE
jgi:uncharacterized phage protein (TIGR02220 family)